MLILSRKVGEKIVIGDQITVVVHRVAGSRVSLGIDAPSDVLIVRGELAHPEKDVQVSSGPQSRRTFIPHLTGLELPHDPWHRTH